MVSVKSIRREKSALLLPESKLNLALILAEWSVFISRKRYKTKEFPVFRGYGQYMDE